jgi:dUTP pyrophosphatase
VNPPLLQIHVLPHGEGLPLPAYKTEGAAGMDLYAAVVSPVFIPSLGRAAVPTGLAMSIPPGYEGQIRPRSGLALRNGLGIPNSPGTIDSDYRGELKILLVNLGQEAFTVTRGMRVAQLVIAPVVQAVLEQVVTLDSTVRGAGGFGSTGLHEV